MFIIQEYRKDLNETWYVCAKPGYYRSKDGTCIRDETSKNGGPEWTTKRDHAFLFISHRSAARVKSLCPSAIIVDVMNEYFWKSNLNIKP